MRDLRRPGGRLESALPLGDHHGLCNLAEDRWAVTKEQPVRSTTSPIPSEQGLGDELTTARGQPWPSRQRTTPEHVPRYLWYRRAGAIMLGDNVFDGYTGKTIGLSSDVRQVYCLVAQGHRSSQLALRSMSRYHLGG